MKILCTGDVHIGRRSSRIPPHLDGSAYSCGTAWTRIVDLAIAERVDLVTVAGDLVDQANRYLEAVGVLEDGFRRLAGAGIVSVVVAGNHDHDVLPALIDSIRSDSVRLLGRGGRWERFTLERAGTRLNLDGWSFPQAHYPADPFESYAPETDGVPTVVVVHCDLDQPLSRYAPVDMARFRRHPDTLFLLGHVHTPTVIEEPGGVRIVYPGSPQALDRGEQGMHGVVIVDLASGAAELRRVPISSVRYEPLEVSVDGVGDPAELEARIYAAARAALDALLGEAEHLRCVRFRLRVTGKTRMGQELESRLAALLPDLELAAGAVAASVESFFLRTEPDYDLAELSRGIGAPAVLARLLSGGEIDERLSGQLRRIASELHGSRAFAEVCGGEEDLRELEVLAETELHRAAAVLLDELMRQKAGLA